MGLTAFLTITGATQGKISAGAGTAESLGLAAPSSPLHSDEILVYAVKGDFTTPRDPVSGVATGAPNFLGFTITKPFDKASPLLFQAWSTGETLTLVLNWYRSDPSGRPSPQSYYRHTFERATIVNLIHYMPNVLAPENAPFAQLEDIQFSYRKLTVDHLISATTGSVSR